MEPFVGEIRLFPYPNAPKGWHACDGSVLQVNSYMALFSLIGAVYGGDGRNTFALPDLRSRVPMHVQPSTTGNIGTRGGVETVTLTPLSGLPLHNHAVYVDSNNATVANPLNNIPATIAPSGSTAAPYTYGPATPLPLVALDPSTVQSSGGGLPHENRQPYVALNYCIALLGLYPSRP